MRRPVRLTAAMIAPLVAVLTGSAACLTLGDAAAAAPAAKPAVSTTSPLARLAPKTIRARAATAMKTATSVHVTGTVVVRKVSYRVDLRVGADADGVLGYARGSMAIRRLGTRLFLSPDDAYYLAHSHPELVTTLHGRWVEIFPDDPDYAQIMPLTRTATWTRLLAGVPATARRAGGTVGGVPTVAISGGKGAKATTTYVATAGAALPAYTRTADRLDHVAFVHWNRAVLVEAVPATLVQPEPPDGVVDIPADAVDTAGAFGAFWKA
jgi:hypothetical protein